MLVICSTCLLKLAVKKKIFLKFSYASTLFILLWTEEIQSKTEEWTTQTAIYGDTLWLQSLGTCNTCSYLANAKIYVLLYSFCFLLYWIWWQSSSEYKTGALVFGGAIYRRLLCLTILGGIFGGAYTWRGLFSELCGRYGKISNGLNTMAPNVKSLARFKKSTLSSLKSGKRKAIGW